MNSRTHIAITTLGSIGDLYPFLSLGQALKRRGHRVTVVATAVHEQCVRDAGLPFQAGGTREQYLETVNDPDLWDPRKGFGVIWRGMQASLERVSAFASALPANEQCVLLAHPLALPVAALARAVRPDLRIVAAYLAPSNLRTCHDPLMLGPTRIPTWMPHSWRRWLWRQIDTRFIDCIALPSLNACRKQLGLPPVEHFFDHLYSVPDLSVTLFPTWFAATQPDWPRPLHLGGFPLYEPQPDAPVSDELERFLSAGNKPIVFTPGTGHRHAAGYFESALCAVQRLGCRAIFLTMHREQLPNALPENVLWQSFVSLRSLLPRVGALVHHGGIGTMAEALHAGIPQLAVPFAYDQFDNAMRIEALGVGAQIPASRVSARSFTTELRRLLGSNRVRLSCRTLAERFASESPVEGICDAILQVAPR